jgi:hypothetical protein
MAEYGMGMDIPLSTIQSLKSQGMSNNQIIQSLQRQGYTSSQIFDALSQAGGASPTGAAPMQQSAGMMGGMGPGMSASPSAGVGGQSYGQSAGSFGAAPSHYGGGFGTSSGPGSGGSYGGGSEQEEMIEAIIDEKWNDLLADINKVIAWKEATDARIAKMEQQMVDLKESFDKLQGAVVGKVGEYDQHILEVGAEVKAMEKVFSKVLPVFTDNVAELSRVADAMKRNAIASGQMTQKKV